jgi:hypothetical protein
MTTSNDMLSADVLITTLSEDTSERSDSLKPSSTKIGHFHKKWLFYRQFIQIGLWQIYFIALLAAKTKIWVL